MYLMIRISVILQTGGGGHQWPFTHLYRDCCTASANILLVNVSFVEELQSKNRFRTIVNRTETIKWTSFKFSYTNWNILWEEVLCISPCSRNLEYFRLHQREVKFTAHSLMHVTLNLLLLLILSKRLDSLYFPLLPDPITISLLLLPDSIILLLPLLTNQMLWDNKCVRKL